jgi:predicted nucleic acid-binding protein
MVKQKIIIDTNILIDHLRQIDTQESESKLQKIIKNEVFVPLISAATIQELFAGQSSKNTVKETEIRNVLGLFRIIPVISTVAELAGKLMRDNQKIIKFADAQIAATAIIQKAYLATENKKDFEGIKGLSLYEKH